MSSKVYKETYFQHDRYARRDPKIKNLLMHFRRESETKALAAVCLYWWIVEDMHTDDYPVDKLEAFADDYRCDVDFLKSILNDFELFHIEDGYYISNRVLRNIKEQEEKSERARQSAQQRWKNESPEEAKFAEDVISILNTEFKKELTVSKENRARINKITKTNNLTLEDWQKVIKNAKRGWDIKGENKKPNLKNILDSWDSFLSDDYYLAPDHEAIEAAKEEKRKEIETEREKELEAEQKEKEEQEEYEQEKEAAYESITNKESSLEYLKKYLPTPLKSNTGLMALNSEFKVLSQKFEFTTEEAKEYFLKG